MRKLIRRVKRKLLNLVYVLAKCWHGCQLADEVQVGSREGMNGTAIVHRQRLLARQVLVRKNQGQDGEWNRMTPHSPPTVPPGCPWMETPHGWSHSGSKMK